MSELRAENKLFNLTDLSKPKIEQSVSGFHSSYLNHHLEKITGFEDLVRIPQQGEAFFMHTEKSFNAFTFIPWLAKRYFIEEIYASSYSISRRVIEALQELMNAGKVGKITLLISDSMIKRNAQTVENLEAVANQNANFEVKYYWNHSKICLVKTGEFHLVLEGSGNWSENAQLEQYILMNQKEVYDFRKTIFEM